ncbi:MAG TPA: methyl-accepting chemotaxis protein, partial [Pseudomonas sp.]|nr:methyl-accepting chemotaxis protein [Pseudomonas sp.]
MKKLFLPAESLMNRLSYPVKFAALGLLVFLAFASLMLALADQLNRTIERSENELAASTLSKPLFELVESSQRHRGLSSMLLSGNAAAAQRRASLQQEIDEALASMARRLPEAERGLREWQAIGGMWGDIRGNGLDWPQARNNQAHT